MDSDLKFKINSTWILVLYVFAAPLIYDVLNSISHPASEPRLIAGGLFLIVVLLYLGRVNLKMILGTPAIILTNDYLVDNLNLRSIDWHNISEIKIIEGNYRSFDKIIINLKRSEEYFNNPVKKARYKFRQLFWLAILAS